MDKHCDATIVVVPPSGILETILSARGYDLRYIIQPEPEGVLDALLRTSGAVSGRCLITFADNLYDDFEFTGARGATTHMMEPNDQLDYWDNNKWCGRGTHPREKAYFSGTICCDAHDLQRICTGHTLLNWMNDIKLTPDRRRNDHWSDLGTPETYYEYLTGK